MLKKLFIDKKIYPIGLGCNLANYKKKNSYKDFKKIIYHAIKNKVSFLDTAPVYGNGESEKIIGQIKNKKNLFITTKISPEMLSPKKIEKSTIQSLKNLKIEQIDLLQIHWPNPDINVYHSIDKLIELKERKIIKAIGLCNYNFFEMNDILKKFKNVISSFQTEYSLFDRTIDGKFDNLLEDNNIQIIAYSPLAQGNICKGNKQMETIINISKKYDLTPAQFTQNWIVKKKKYLPLTHTLNKIRLLENINSIKKNIYTKDFNILEKKIFTKLQYTDTKKIIFFSKKSKTNYKNKKEALANRFGMIPSPINFSKNIKNNYIKPIRLKEKNINKVKKLYLIEGRLRFWAWIIAFGWKEKIPSLIWKE
jgi:diketogulonate reductase-like aldo/keto reductase